MKLFSQAGQAITYTYPERYGEADRRAGVGYGVCRDVGGAMIGPSRVNSMTYLGRNARVVTSTRSMRSTRYERCSPESARIAWRRKFPSRVRRSEYGSISPEQPAEDVIFLDNVEAEPPLTGTVVEVSTTDHVSRLPGAMVPLRRRFQRRVNRPVAGSDGSSRLKPLLSLSRQAAISSGTSIPSTSMR